MLVLVGRRQRLPVLRSRRRPRGSGRRSPSACASVWLGQQGGLAGGVDDEAGRQLAAVRLRPTRTGPLRESSTGSVATRRRGILPGRLRRWPWRYLAGCGRRWDARPGRRGNSAGSPRVHRQLEGAGVTAPDHGSCRTWGGSWQPGRRPLRRALPGRAWRLAGGTRRRGRGGSARVSSRTTCQPCFASMVAAALPAGPPPTMATSAMGCRVISVRPVPGVYRPGACSKPALGDSTIS